MVSDGQDASPPPPGRRLRRRRLSASSSAWRCRSSREGERTPTGQAWQHSSGGRPARGKVLLDPDRVGLYHQHLVRLAPSAGPSRVLGRDGRALRVHDEREPDPQAPAGQPKPAARQRVEPDPASTLMLNLFNDPGTPRALGSSSRRVSSQALYMLIESVPQQPGGCCRWRAARRRGGWGAAPGRGAGRGAQGWCRSSAQAATVQPWAALAA